MHARHSAYLVTFKPRPEHLRVIRGGWSCCYFTQNRYLRYRLQEAVPSFVAFAFAIDVLVAPLWRRLSLSRWTTFRAMMYRSAHFATRHSWPTLTARTVSPTKQLGCSDLPLVLWWPSTRRPSSSSCQLLSRRVRYPGFLSFGVPQHRVALIRSSPVWRLMDSWSFATRPLPSAESPRQRPRAFRGLGAGVVVGLLHPLVARTDGDVHPFLRGLVLIRSRTNLVAVSSRCRGAWDANVSREVIAPNIHGDWRGSVRGSKQKILSTHLLPYIDIHYSSRHASTARTRSSGVGGSEATNGRCMYDSGTNEFFFFPIQSQLDALVASYSTGKGSGGSRVHMESRVHTRKDRAEDTPL